jgi:hypothetical protein
MAVMGFSIDPGPLPFVTVRDRDKWLTRIEGLPFIELQVDRGGFTLPPRARIAKIEEHVGTCPAELLPVYHGKKLIRVHLEALDG